jgi:hypothetical protein
MAKTNVIIPTFSLDGDPRQRQDERILLNAIAACHTGCMIWFHDRF